MKTPGLGHERLPLPGWLAIALLFAVTPAVQASDRSVVLEAIHSIENPNNLTRPGRHGELGAYQFRAETWRMHSPQPFQRALERERSDEVAVLHYEWIRRGLLRNKCPVTPYNIALAWNSGLAAAVRGRAPARAHDYAQRVTNLATENRGPVFASAP